MTYLQTINESFTDDEMRKLKKIKGDMTWHTFIIEAAKAYDSREGKE